MSSTLLLGLDLAWSPRNPSGVALGVLEQESPQSGSELPVQHIRLQQLGTLLSNAELLGALDTWLEQNLLDANQSLVAAVDAPLVVPNATGSRTTDRLATRLLGPFQAGVYPANRNWLGKYGGERIWELAEALERLGIVQPQSGGRLPRRLQVEVFPHALQLAAFDLAQSLKYKSRGDHARQERDLQRLRAGLAGLQAATPSLAPHPLLTELPPRNLRGKARKAHEDQLDALCCLYQAGALAANPQRQLLLCPPQEEPATHGAIVAPDGWGNAAYCQRRQRVEQEQGWAFPRLGYG